MEEGIHDSYFKYTHTVTITDCRGERYIVEFTHSIDIIDIKKKVYDQLNKNITVAHMDNIVFLSKRKGEYPYTYSDKDVIISDMHLYVFIKPRICNLHHNIGHDHYKL